MNGTDDGEFDSFCVPSDSRKRKSLLPDNRTASSSSALDIDNVDHDGTDMLNQTKKRRSVLLSKIAANKSKNKTLSEQDSNASVRFHTADELKDQYERAMKLHMSNKINDKNVFKLNLNLIECIHQRYQTCDKINFQNAAVEIEAGYKIWGYKVDAMYKDATQAVKDLIESKSKLDQDDDEENDPEEIDGTKKDKKKRKRLQEVTWTEENSSKITNSKMSDKKNPYLQIRAAKLDSATDISALWLSNSHAETSTGGIRPNEDGFKLQRPAEIIETEYNPGEWIPDSLISDIEEFTKEIVKLNDIAPSFGHQALKDELTTPVPVQLSQKPIDRPEVPTFDFDDVQEDVFPDDVPYEDDDPNDIPLPPSLVENEDEVRSSVGDNVSEHIFGMTSHGIGNSNRAIETNESSLVSNGITTGSEDITDAISMISLGSEASRLFDDAFNGSNIFRKPRLPSRLRILSNAEQLPDNVAKRAKPKRAKTKPIDRKTADIILAEELDDLEILDRMYNRKKKIQDDPSKFLIDEHEAFVERDISGFSSKQYSLREMRYRIHGMRMATEEEASNEQPSEEHNLPDASSGVSDCDEFPEPLFAPGDDYADDDAPHFPDETFTASTQDNGPGLPQPEIGNADHESSLLTVKQVEKIKMKFDRRNRRVNVKTVKKEMWNVITDANNKSAIFCNEKENIVNMADSLPSTTFSDLQEELQNKLEGENKENLSPAMALVCVLYLANEKKLELEQTTQSDFLIKAPTAEKAT